MADLGEMADLLLLRGQPRQRRATQDQVQRHEFADDHGRHHHPPIPVLGLADGGVERLREHLIQVRAASPDADPHRVTAHQVPQEIGRHPAVAAPEEGHHLAAHEVPAVQHDELEEGGVTRRIPSVFQRGDAFEMGHRESRPEIQRSFEAVPRPPSDPPSE